MRITHCLMSCDSNPEYLEFWPVVAKAWLKLGIQPVLFYIASDKHAPLEIADCPVHIFDPIPDIPIKLQSYALRLWGCRHYPNDIVVISDIDVIPLSKKFLTDCLRDIDDDYYVHRRVWPRINQKINPRNAPNYGRIGSEDILREHAIDHANYLPICYNIARGDIMSRVLGFSDSWENDFRRIVPYWYKASPPGKSFSPEQLLENMNNHKFPYNGDEIYVSVMVEIARRNGQKVKLLSYSKKDFDWIFRNIPENCNKEKLRSGYYTCLHAPRPYSKYKEAIDAFLNLHDSLQSR